MKNKKNDIKDFFDGKLTKKEAKEFLNWYLSTYGEETISKDIEKLWEEPGVEEKSQQTSWDPLAILPEITNTKENQRFLVQKAANESRHRWSTILFKTAAVVTLLVAATAIIWAGAPLFGRDETPPRICEIEKSNPTGQKSTIFLADGSKIILNSASKVCYPNNFGENRSIRLEGEAFFEIKEDSKHPFVVHTRDLTTTALGTSFNIKAYSDHTDVALVSGKVSVEEVTNPETKLILGPGEAATLSETLKLVKSKFDYSKKIAWKDGVIHFKDTPLDDAMQTIERWYGVEITYQNKPPEGLYCTGEFKNDYLSNVLESIGFTLGFEYEIANKTVELNFK